jgi:hypothetical protein
VNVSVTNSVYTPGAFTVTLDVVNKSGFSGSYAGTLFAQVGPLLKWIGVAFAIIGAVDLALAWYPANLGNAEWEFGAITATMNGFAFPLLGLFLALASAVELGDRTFARVVGGLMFALVGAWMIVGLLYATVVPLALNAVAANSDISRGMKKAVVKGAILLLTYVILLSYGSWMCQRRA